MHIGSGHPYPLGATWDGAGVNFALYENSKLLAVTMYKRERKLSNMHLGHEIQ